MRTQEEATRMRRQLATALAVVMVSGLATTPLAASLHDPGGAGSDTLPGTTVRVLDSTMEPDFGQEAEIKSPAAAPGDLFGTLAIDGKTLAVTTMEEDVGDNDEGVVRVFQRTPQGWEMAQRILAPDIDENETDFGTEQIALDGDTLIVEDTSHDVDGMWKAGAVYFFERVDGEWIFQKKVTGQSTYTSLGRGLALSGDTAFVESGRSTHVYTRVNGTWTNTQSLPVAASAWRFGSYSLWDDVGVIGDKNDERAYVYTRGSDGWTRAATLSDPSGSDEFGIATDVRGDRIIVGEEREAQAHIFHRTPQGWALEQTLEGPHRSFGYAVALSDTRAFVGAPTESIRPGPEILVPNPGQRTGAVYVFNNTADGAGEERPWAYEGRLIANDAASRDHLSGRIIEFSQGTLAVPALGDDGDHQDPAANEGSAYVFSLDSDGDALADRNESWNGIDPHDPDTDGDRIDDGTEMTCGWDANDPASPSAAGGPTASDEAPPAPVGEHRWWLCGLAGS